MILAVIFDLDGVLVTTDNCHFNAWKRMADEEGILFNREINQRLRGVRFYTFVFERHKKSRYGGAAHMAERLASVLSDKFV